MSETADRLANKCPIISSCALIKSAGTSPSYPAVIVASRPRRALGERRHRKEVGVDQDIFRIVHRLLGEVVVEIGHAIDHRIRADMKGRNSSSSF